MPQRRDPTQRLVGSCILRGPIMTLYVFCPTEYVALKVQAHRSPSSFPAESNHPYVTSGSVMLSIISCVSTVCATQNIKSNRRNERSRASFRWEEWCGGAGQYEQPQESRLTRSHSV